jgi:hypothetical protein
MVILAIAIIFSMSFLNGQNLRAEIFIPYPAAVTLSSPAQTETTITLSWTESPNSIFSGYIVEYSTSVNGPYGPYTTLTTITDRSQTTYAVTGLNYTASYYFIVVNTANDAATNSNTLQTYTNAPPQLFYLSSNDTTVSLRWDDYNSYSSLIPFYGFVLQTRVGNNQFSTVATINDVNSNSYTVTDLTAGQTYQFKLIDEVGTSGQYQSSSEIESASTQATPTPTPEFPTPAYLIILLTLALVAVTVLTIAKRRIRYSQSPQ